MIIDSHVHLFFEGSHPEAFFIGSARAGIGFFNKNSGDLDADISRIYETQLQLLSDKNGDKLVAKMNEAGIDKAVILPLDFWLGVPKSKGMSIEEKNIPYGEATAHPYGIQ